MITVIIRTLLIYIILIIGMRFTGKRQIGELQVSELVVTFMLSELAVFPISDKNVPLSHAILPIVILLSSEVILSHLQTKSDRIKRLFCDKPTVLVRRGKLDPSALREVRMEIEELLGELRLNGVFDLADVEYAIMEENGKLSVLTKASSSPFTPEQLEITVSEKGCAHLVISDGVVVEEELIHAGKNRRWLEKYLEEMDLSLEKVFLMTVNDGGGISLHIKKGEKQSNG